MAIGDVPFTSTTSPSRCNSAARVATMIEGVAALRNSTNTQSTMVLSPVFVKAEGSITSPPPSPACVKPRAVYGSFAGISDALLGASAASDKRLVLVPGAAPTLRDALESFVTTR